MPLLYFILATSPAHLTRLGLIAIMTIINEDYEARRYVMFLAAFMPRAPVSLITVSSPAP
jgi:hypothetical protein